MSGHIVETVRAGGLEARRIEPLVGRKALQTGDSLVGFGTAGLRGMAGAEARAAALNEGYRLLDSAGDTAATFRTCPSLSVVIPEPDPGTQRQHGDQKAIMV